MNPIQFFLLNNMKKSTILIFTLALVISLLVQINAQSCTLVGYRDRTQLERSSSCPNDNRCCNTTDTARIAELFRKQRERCWTTAFNNSRNTFNAFLAQFENLIEQIVRRSAIDFFGNIQTTPTVNGDYYDDVSRINSDDIGDMARDYIRNNTDIELVRERFESVACSLLASRVLVNNFRDLQRNYSICGGCLCNRVIADNTQVTLGTLVRGRIQNAWLRYFRHLQRLRTTLAQIRNISLEAVPSRQIVQLCDSEVIRLLGCRRCAGFTEGTCDRVCTSVMYFCREAYRRLVLVYQNAPRIFLTIARALREENSPERNEFSPDNTREAVSILNRDIDALVLIGLNAFQIANRGNRNVSTQLCIFKNTGNNEDGDSSNPTAPSQTKQICRQPTCSLNNCGDICGLNNCNGNARFRCTPPSCSRCPTRGTAECECQTATRNCNARRRRDVENINRRDTDTTLSNYILMFYNLANAANEMAGRIAFSNIFQSNCVCGTTLDRYREIALGRSGTCYNPLGEFTLDENFRNNPIYTRLSSTQQMQYQEGASVVSLENDLNTFEMQVIEGNNVGGNNAERMSYNIVTALLSLMLILLFS